MACLLDMASCQRNLSFITTILCHFYASDEGNSDYVAQILLINCDHSISLNSSAVGEIVFSYSKSTAPHLADSKHTSNADSDMKTFLAYMDCSNAHLFEDLIQPVPLVQTLDD